MLITIQLSVADALCLCELHHRLLELAQKSQDPQAYALAARITSNVMGQVAEQVPDEELDNS